MDVTESQLAGALERFCVRVRPTFGVPVTAEVADADATAAALFATLSRMAALREPPPKCTGGGCPYCDPEPVVDARICCDECVTDPELSAMDVAVNALEPLDGQARARVMRWLIDRLHADL